MAQNRAEMEDLKPSALARGTILAATAKQNAVRERVVRIAGKPRAPQAVLVDCTTSIGWMRPPMSMDLVIAHDIGPGLYFSG